MDLLIEIRNQLDSKLKSLGSSDAGFMQKWDEDMDIAMRKTRQSLMKKLIQASLKAGKEGGTMQEIYNKVGGLVPSSSPSKGVFITVNFDDKKIVPEKIPEYMDKVIKKKWIVEYEYTIEQRNETEGNYAGFHVHCLLTGHAQKRKSEIVREFYSSLSKYLGSKQSIDVRPVSNPQGVIKYMQGDKKDEWKHTKVVNDKKMREHFKFKELYKKEAGA